MRAPPRDVSDHDVLALVRHHWDAEVTVVTHLPVGFGAYHWRAETAAGPRLFVSLDTPTPRHTGTSLEAAYASAAELAWTLDFVWPSLPSHLDETYTVALGPGRLSVTGWLEGRRPEPGTTDLAPLLDRLHDSTAPDRTWRWTSTVDHHFPDQLDLLVEQPWVSGPLGEEARTLLSPRVAQVREWSEEHADRLARLDPDSYVLTHGEPGEHNQWQAEGRTWLLDWESLLLAPAERDLGTLVRSGVRCERADAERVRLFDLEWRLSEIQACTASLAGPHADGADAREAMGALRDELTRSPVAVRP